MPRELLRKTSGVWCNLQRICAACQYDKEPHSMEIFLKKLYLRRMAADLGITRIYSLGKMIFMKTNMSKKVSKMMTESMASDLHRNSLVLEGDQIKVLHRSSLVPFVIFSRICLCNLVILLIDVSMIGWRFHMFRITILDFLFVWNQSIRTQSSLRTSLDELLHKDF